MIPTLSYSLKSILGGISTLGEMHPETDNKRITPTRNSHACLFIAFPPFDLMLFY